MTVDHFAAIACCDPPCRLMRIQDMPRGELMDALVNAEFERDQALAYIAEIRVAVSGGSR